MATIRLPRDFSEFLRLLNSSGVDYLLVGGYAVNFYGYSRSTGNIDIWVARNEPNAVRLTQALRAFGFENATETLFTVPDQIIRMGVPPLRIEILTSVSGVDFEECYARRATATLDGVPLPLISFDDLKANKMASGRLKDLADLEALE
ncbi:MAG: hypothetical protein JOY54_15365 [Acidobacteriaceae bacterium]|nr:hypothetical protein [Acidobacteriaceae bacterium]